MVMKEKIMPRLKEICKKYLTDARPGDWEHTLRTVEWLKYLIKHEGGDEDVLIPAAYLHDVGWHCALPEELRNKGIKNEELRKYFPLHLEKGAELAKKILTELNYSEDKTERISHLISIHDLPERIREKDEVLLMEADRLDRFGKVGLERIRGVFSSEEMVKSMMKSYEREVKNWFRTRTGKETYKRLLIEMKEKMNKT